MAYEAVIDNYKRAYRERYGEPTRCTDEAILKFWQDTRSCVDSDDQDDWVLSDMRDRDTDEPQPA